MVLNALCPRQYFCVLTVAVVTLLAGCSSDDEPQVVAYVSADDYVARQVIDAFETKHGIDVQMLGDTEATKTTGLVNRLRIEADHPQADVFWSSECFMMIQLADEGILQPYVSATTSAWPSHLRDEEHRWHGFGMRARVIAYAPGRVSADDVPRTWLDLGKARYKGRIAMADPRFGTTRGHMGAMYATWREQFGEAGYIAYLENLRDNEVSVLTSGNAGVVQAIASGEVDFGMTDTDDVWAAQRNGADIDLIYPSHGLADQPGLGTLLIPNTVAMIKGARHPEAAATFIEFLLSPEAERILAESDSHNIPVNPDVAADFSEYAVENPLEIRLDQVASHMDRAVELAMRILGGPG